MERKTVVGTIVFELTLLAQFVADARSAGIEAPTWLALVAGVVGPVAMWFVANRNLSPSTIAAAAAGE